MSEHYQFDGKGDDEERHTNICEHDSHTETSKAISTMDSDITPEKKYIDSVGS